MYYQPTRCPSPLPPNLEKAKVTNTCSLFFSIHSRQNPRVHFDPLHERTGRARRSGKSYQVSYFSPCAFRSLCSKKKTPVSWIADRSFVFVDVQVRGSGVERPAEHHRPALAQAGEATVIITSYVALAGVFEDGTEARARRFVEPSDGGSACTERG